MKDFTRQVGLKPRGWKPSPDRDLDWQQPMKLVVQGEAVHIARITRKRTASIGQLPHGLARELIDMLEAGVDFDVDTVDIGDGGRIVLELYAEGEQIEEARDAIDRARKARAASRRQRRDTLEREQPEPWNRRLVRWIRAKIDARAGRD